MIYYLHIALGVLLPILWLLYYLSKDIHPESKKMIAIVFVLGMLSIIPTLALELAIQAVFDTLNIMAHVAGLALSLVVLFHRSLMAFVEELIKYLVVKYKVIKNAEFDEPVDAMIYMIVAALGFATLENILFLLDIAPPFIEEQLIITNMGRFLLANLLHVLWSALVGYCLAVSIMERNRMILVRGIILASFLHGLFNFSIIESEKSQIVLLIPLLLVLGLSVFVNYGFKRLKKLKSVCKIC